MTTVWCLLAFSIQRCFSPSFFFLSLFLLNRPVFIQHFNPRKIETGGQLYYVIRFVNTPRAWYITLSQAALLTERTGSAHSHECLAFSR